MIDAEKSDDAHLARYINHADERYANLVPKYHYDETTETGRIILFACKDIQIGEQYFYDYGEKRPQMLKKYPFLRRLPEKSAKTAFEAVSLEVPDPFTSVEEDMANFVLELDDLADEMEYSNFTISSPEMTKKSLSSAKKRKEIESFEPHDDIGLVMSVKKVYISVSE